MRPNHLVNLLLALMLCGCGVASYGVKTEHPGNVYRTKPTVEFAEVRNNMANVRFGSLYVGAVVTMKSGEKRVLSLHEVAILPYTEGLWNDLSILYRWKGSHDMTPDAIARSRDAEKYITQTFEISKEQAGAGGVQNLIRKYSTRTNGEIELKNEFPAGRYILLSSYRTQYAWIEWLMDFRIEEKQTKKIQLTNSTAFFIW